ncbi:hypothetical protein GETHOR_20260 [Geothrix oryzae]|uniref:Protein kinase domain-containing protein n=1 Tax=Geothrix oryzae TaxID=2927975 RepID=A0ABM8DSD1_9BACT|nr:protein kinase [Geothrix oryzae]BDU69925.1 hypothetical protein GETHOR_20260 [Geothrix oryzae]
MPRPLLLIVEGESYRTPGLVSAMEGDGWAVRWVGAAGAESFLQTGLDPDLLLVELASPEAVGHRLVQVLRERRPTLPVLAWVGEQAAEARGKLDLQGFLEQSGSEAEILAALRRYRPEDTQLTTDDIFGDLLADLERGADVGPSPGVSSSPVSSPVSNLEPRPEPPADPFSLFEGGAGWSPEADGHPVSQPPLSAADIFGRVIEEVEALPVPRVIPQAVPRAVPLPVAVPERGNLPVAAVKVAEPLRPAAAPQAPVAPPPALTEPLGPSDFTLSGISGVNDPFEWAGEGASAPPAAPPVARPAAGGAPEVLEEYGNYFLLEKIAIGGMAELFKAQQRGVQGFQKIVAIKRILPHFSDNEDFVTMFIDEAKLAAQLTHPNIVQIFDLGKAGSSHYIAMEYVNGRDLRTLLRKVREYGQPFPEQIAAFVVMKVAAALDYAHRKRGFDDRELKLVHRDISPQNVILSTEGAVKLVDFGIAKAANKASHTVAGALKGKLLYMSPEQATGQPLDNRSDLYSLGLVLFELLTGERCFQADSELGVLEKVRLGRVSDLHALNPNVSRDMVAIVNRALQKSVDHRYPSARFMERDLRDYLQRLGTPIAEHDVAEYVNALLNGTRERLEHLVATQFPVPTSLTSGAYRSMGDHTGTTAPYGRAPVTASEASPQEPAADLPEPPKTVVRPRWLLPLILGLAVLLVVMLAIARWS